MTGRPTYLTADCETAKPNMSQVDGGGNTLSKNEDPVQIPRLSWRMPSIAMSVLKDDYDNYNGSGGGGADRMTKMSGGIPTGGGITWI